MRTIATHVTIPDDGRLSLQLELGITPGEYQVLVVIEEQQHIPRRPLDFPIINVGEWRETSALRREDIYGDNGR